MTMTTEQAGTVALDLLSKEIGDDLRSLIGEWIIILIRRGIPKEDAIALMKLILPTLLKQEVEHFVHLEKSDEVQQSPVEKGMPQIADLLVEIIAGVGMKAVERLEQEGISLEAFADLIADAFNRKASERGRKVVSAPPSESQSSQTAADPEPLSESSS